MGFWEKVRKTDRCWDWTGATQPNGYGVAGHAGKTCRAHRIAFELTCGKIPTGMVICHSCDNRLCVNPSHLFIGTQKENLQDAVRKGRTARGEKNGRSKLTNIGVKLLIAMVNAGIGKCQTAKMLGVDRKTVFNIISKRSRTEVTNGQSSQ